jgi:hypothetical protein
VVLVRDDGDTLKPDQVQSTWMCAAGGGGSTLFIPAARGRRLCASGGLLEPGNLSCQAQRVELNMIAFALLIMTKATDSRVQVSKEPLPRMRQIAAKPRNRCPPRLTPFPSGGW